jgi:hypothetical protein
MTVAVAAMGVDGRCAECADIWSGDGNIFEIGVEVMRNVARCGLGLRGESSASGMLGSVCGENTRDGAKRQLQGKEKQAPARGPIEEHEGSNACAGKRTSWFRG